MNYRVLIIAFLLSFTGLFPKEKDFDSVIFNIVQQEQYYVIAAVFKSYYYAYDYVKDLQKRGYDNAEQLSLDENNRYKVSVNKFQTIKEAEIFINSNKNLKNLWIFDISNSNIVPTKVELNKIDNLNNDIDKNFESVSSNVRDISEQINDEVFDNDILQNDIVNSETNFHVIVASFKSFYNSFDYVKELKEKGYKKAIQLDSTDSDRYRVSINNFKTKQEAEKFISENNSFKNVSIVETKTKKSDQIDIEESLINNQNNLISDTNSKNIDTQIDEFENQISELNNQNIDQNAVLIKDEVSEIIDQNQDISSINEDTIDSEKFINEDVNNDLGFDNEEFDEYSLVDESDIGPIEDYTFDQPQELFDSQDDYAPQIDEEGNINFKEEIVLNQTPNESIDTSDVEDELVISKDVKSEGNSNIFDAKRRYDEKSYVKAQNKYKDIVRAAGRESRQSYEYLANTYYNNSQYDKAVIWYNKLLVKFPNKVEEETLFKAALSFKSVGAYDISDDLMTKYLEKSNNLIIKNEFERNPNYLDSIYSNSNKHRIFRTNINTENSEFGPNFYGTDKVIYSSTTSSTGDEEYEWSGQKYLDLYVAELDSLERLINPKILEGNINTQYHESSATFTKDLKTVYFTRNNFIDGKLSFDRKKEVKLKIYRATTEDDGLTWNNIVELPFNSDEYSTAHPTLSNDGRRLYFASDMNGSYGYSDIWYVDIFEIDDEIEYGLPINLGPKVNTEFRESFPYLDDNNILYFSSDGKIGLGGFDVFKTQLNRRGFPGEAVNMAEPINSPFDDFGFVYNNSKKFGYISSNRSGFEGSKSDQVYKVKLNECDYVIEGIVKDKNTKELIPGAYVKLLNLEGEVLAETRADQEARYIFDKDFKCENSYFIEVSNGIGYDSVRTKITTSDFSDKLVEDFDLDWSKEGCLPNDLDCLLKLNPIYFDLDKSYITSKARVELSKVYVALTKYPQMKIRIESHTDSRASDKYNNDLSERRAKSTKGWLVNKGIMSDRIEIIGFGEKQLENYCEDNVDCDEAEHQLNRRSTFTIIN